MKFGASSFNSDVSTPSCCAQFYALSNTTMTVSDKAYSLTHSQKTLTAALAASPASSPGDLVKTLYAEHHKKPVSSVGYLETFMGVLQHGNDNETQRLGIPPGEPTQTDLDRAAECGDFGSRPSDLFLKVSEVRQTCNLDSLHKKIYCDVLATLDTNPWAGVVSPPLLGSRGVVNLSIISV